MLSETETNKAISRDFLERAFNQVDLSSIDEYQAADGVDHQEPPGTDYRNHLREVVVGLRTAFPDLHFELDDMLAEGDRVAFRATMTGTHLGSFELARVHVPPTGRKISVPHLYIVRVVNGQTTDLWHQWDIPGMLRQLGVMPMQQPA